MLHIRHDIGNDIPPLSHYVQWWLSLLNFGLMERLPLNLGLGLCVFAYGPLPGFISISILSFTYTSMSRKEVCAKAKRRA